MTALPNRVILFEPSAERAALWASDDYGLQVQGNGIGLDPALIQLDIVSTGTALLDRTDSLVADDTFGSQVVVFEGEPSQGEVLSVYGAYLANVILEKADWTYDPLDFDSVDRLVTEELAHPEAVADASLTESLRSRLRQVNTQLSSADHPVVALLDGARERTSHPNYMKRQGIGGTDIDGSLIFDIFPDKKSKRNVTMWEHRAMCHMLMAVTVFATHGYSRLQRQCDDMRRHATERSY